MRTHTSHQDEPRGHPVHEQPSPAWPYVGVALALGCGLGLMVNSLALTLPHSRTLPSETLALVDTCYMTGFSLVLVALLALPWAVIHRGRRQCR